MIKFFLYGSEYRFDGVEFTSDNKDLLPLLNNELKNFGGSYPTLFVLLKVLSSLFSTEFEFTDEKNNDFYVTEYKKSGVDPELIY